MPNSTNKAVRILMNTLPVWIMIGLIPFVVNDYILTFIYAILIVGAFKFHYAKNDLLVLCFGFFIMILSELLFVSTGVEAFTRNTLFGMMPMWLPFLWAYGFVAIKRSVEILNS